MEMILYALSGFSMKLSDDAHDKKKNKPFGILAGILCGFCIGYLVTISIDAACIFFGILIGTLAAKKIDCVNHVLSLVVFLAVTLFFGIPAIGIIPLLICSFAAYVDEIGNDGKLVFKKSKWQVFFKYRFALKTAVLVLASFGILQSIFPALESFQFLHIASFLYFLMFEMFYEIAGLKFDAIYDGFCSVLRAF